MEVHISMILPTFCDSMFICDFEVSSPVLWAAVKKNFAAINIVIITKFLKIFDYENLHYTVFNTPFPYY